MSSICSVLIATALALSAASTSPAVSQEQPRPFETVVAELKSPDARTRLEAVRQLAATGYPEIALPLAGVLADPDDRVAREAMYGELAMFLGRPFETRAGTAGRAFDDSWGSLPIMPVPGEVIEGLSRRLTGENLGLRLEAMAALAVLGQVDGSAPTSPHDKAADALTQRLADPHATVRAAAARAAGRLFRRCPAPCDSPAIVRFGDALTRSLNDSDPDVHLAVLEALGEMRYARALDALNYVYLSFVKDAPGLAALHAIARIGSPSSVPLFKEAAARPEPAARRAALEGLARAGDRDALSAAVRQAQEGRPSEEVTLGAAFALQRARLGEHLSPLLAAAGGRDTALQVQDYLVELGPSAASQVAASLASSPEAARIRLIEVLAVIGGAEQVPALQAVRAAGGGSGGAFAAERALRRLGPPGR